MLRRCTVLLLACIPLAAVAAPVPPPSEKERIAKLWGKTEGEGEFELDGRRLTIRTVGKPARGTDMPRATRTVKGDFEATVTVADAAPPGKGYRHEDLWPDTRAGAFIWGGGSGVELYLYQYFPKANRMPQEQPKREVWVDKWFARSVNGSGLKQAEGGKSPRLRIIRKGKDVTVSYSFDGKEWSQPLNPGQELEFPDEVTVGVFFGHSTYQIAAATFGDFTITKPKDEK